MTGMIKNFIFKEIKLVFAVILLMVLESVAVLCALFLTWAGGKVLAFFGYENDFWGTLFHFMTQFSAAILIFILVSSGICGVWKVFKDEKI